MHQTASGMIETLLPIWRQVLRVETVRVEDNFFDLGGDSVLALELFNRIADVCGRELPPVMIYHAPTVAALASILEQSIIPHFPPLVQLKEGIAPSVFITHGLGGSVMDFFQVIKHIETPHSIYGMQAKGIDGIQVPLTRIEEMAQYSLAAVRDIQPHGPYILIGYSLGGLVALEMAQHLQSSGGEIALLAMLDSYPHVNQLPRRERATLAFQQFWRRAIRKVTQSTRKAQPSSETSLTPTLRRFRESGHQALERYRPRLYQGKIRFVRAAELTDFPANPESVWAHLADEFSVETVSGNHLGIMTTHYKELANVLSRYIKEALV